LRIKTTMVRTRVCSFAFRRDESPTFPTGLVYLHHHF
jgi:hypothetical protein